MDHASRDNEDILDMDVAEPSASELVLEKPLSAGGISENPMIGINGNELKINAVYISSVEATLAPMGPTDSSEHIVSKPAHHLAFLLGSYQPSLSLIMISLSLRMMRSILDSVSSRRLLTLLDLKNVSPKALVGLKIDNLRLGMTALLHHRALSYDDHQIDLETKGIFCELYNAGLFRERSLFKFQPPPPLSFNRGSAVAISWLMKGPSSPPLPAGRPDKLTNDAEHMPLFEDFGICRVHAQVGDHIYVVPGCSFPLLLRPWN